MKKSGKYLLLIIMLLAMSAANAQFDPKSICRFENGKLFFRIDLRWNQQQQKELIRLFDLDTVVVKGVYQGKTGINAGGAEWHVVRLNDHLVELSKVFTPPDVRPSTVRDVVMLDDRWLGNAGAAERVSASYGVNKFTRYSVFQYSKGIARFFLPGRKSARQVVLSGSFNGWSTSQIPMTPSDSGWMVQVKLLPGKYSYKYVVDGKWTPDPYNRQMEDDGTGNFNSIVFCYNYSFRLGGYRQAHNVVVAGSFNNWNEKELKMIPVGGNWVLSLYLKEGTHSYKFIVDDQWITDPANRLKRPDGAGNFNSVAGLGDSVLFFLKGYPAAKKVHLGGNFNLWNPEELAMEKTRTGWKLYYRLGPGIYEYKFIVDGKWITDPSNPNSTGTGVYENSVLAVKPNHQFVLRKYPDARKVIVTGSFNDWNTFNYKMVKRNGEWFFPIYLIPGKYTYKFIVDNEWILDPGNDLWEKNEYGTGNSVIWIEP